MNRAVEELLASHIRGEQDADSFLVAIEALLVKAPETGPEVISILELACRRGEISEQIFASAMSRFAAPTRRETFTGNGFSESDRTVIRGRSLSKERPGNGTLVRRKVPDNYNDDQTLVRPKKVLNDDDGTLVNPDPQLSPEELTPASEKQLCAGTRIKNRFVLQEQLGSGGMGVVFRALDQRREEAKDRHPHVAIKFLNAEFRHHPESLIALQRETTKAQGLAHPNIVTVHDFDRDGTLIYMTMEYLDGRPLDLMLRQDFADGMTFDEAWPIIDGAGQALSYAHKRSIVHSDFKPGNVFVMLDGRVKVLDFGIARAVSTAELNAPDATVFDAGRLGALTPAYASPEMHINLDPDFRDDVYGLACVTYELLTGRHPFGGLPATAAQHRKLSPKRVKGLSRRRMKAIEHGLAFVREDRTASVEQFLDELAGPASIARRRRALILVLCGMMAAVAIAGALWWATRPDPDVLFVDRILQEAANNAPPDHEANTRLRDVLLEQGADYLSLAEVEFNPALLSEGVSSAYGAFTGALKMDPDSREAAEGILRVVRRYEHEARRLADSGDLAGSLTIAGYGLRIDPENEILREIRDEAHAVGSD